jgi:hypothetical protein
MIVNKKDCVVGNAAEKGNTVATSNGVEGKGGGVH